MSYLETFWKVLKNRNQYGFNEYTADRIMELYFNLSSHDGTPIMEESWDVLLLLDGCRYDLFEEVNTISGDLSPRYSLATRTLGFLSENFQDSTHHDTVYVTANPMYSVDEWIDIDFHSVFHDIVDVWQERWDEETNTVPPDEMAEATREAARTYPDKRILAHFVQPPSVLV